MFYSSILSLLLIACGGGSDNKDTTTGDLATEPVTGGADPKPTAPTDPNPIIPGALVDGLEFSSTSYQVSESGATAAITVRRNGDVSTAVSVTYSVDANASTATADQDYTTVQGTLSWAVNDSVTKTFYVPIKGDNINDPNETISLVLKPVNNALLADNTIATLTIQDATCDGILDSDIIIDTVISDLCVIVSRSISVRSNAKLIINPGVTLIFQTGSGINVQAGSYLKADGSVSQPIVFTAESPTPGYWRGIQFTTSNDLNNILNYVTVEYAGAGYNGKANVNLFGVASVSITNSTLNHSSGYGFKTHYTSTINSFANNTFFANDLNPVDISPDLVGNLDTKSSYRGNAVDAIKVFSTTSAELISTTQTWAALEVPYSVGNLKIGSPATGAVGTTLTIEPGTILKFRANSTLKINKTGTLVAKGTNTQPILLTADSNNPLTGFWNGLTYFGSNNNNILDYVTVEYGGGNSNNSNIYLWNARNTLSMTNSTSRFSSGYGLLVHIQAMVKFPTFSGNVLTKNDLEPIKIPARNVDIFNSSNQLTGNAIDQIYVDTPSSSPSVTLPLTWSKAEVPFSVNRLNVTSDLTIEPGVEIEMRNDTLIGRISIDRGGSLSAIGTSTQAIIIRGAVSPKPGYWEGLRFFQSSSLANNLQFVTISDAGIFGNANLAFGNISISLNSSVTIENSTISDSATNGIGVLESNGTGTLLGDLTTNTFININTNTVDRYANIFRF